MALPGTRLLSSEGGWSGDDLSDLEVKDKYCPRCLQFHAAVLLLRVSRQDTSVRIQAAYNE